MAPKLYGDIRSPCVRAVMLLARAMNFHLEFIRIDIVKKEQMTDQFLRLNPRHSVPTLDDDGFVLWDSHAIMIYLCEKYGDDNPLYPKDLHKRSVINQMLHFENGCLFSMHLYIVTSIYIDHLEKPKRAVEMLKKGYEHLETFLKQSKFIAGDEMTIADFSVWTTISNSGSIVTIDEIKYPALTAWIKTLDSLPYSHLNRQGHDEYTKILDDLKRE